MPSAADYVVQMRKMLALAKDNIRQVMDRAKSYADVNRSFREFEEGEKVFLKVPSHSKIFDFRSVRNYQLDIVGRG